MIRRVIFAVLLLAIGCKAQSPSAVDADINRNIARHVRGMLQAPPYVNIAVKSRQAGSDFEGYDTVVVTLSAGSRTQDVKLLISKDNKTLASVQKIDLTKDPYANTLSKLNITGRPVRGNKDAKVTVVVFDDFQCPYCSRMHQTLNNVLKTYGDRIKLVYKDFPLFEIHPWAGRAAINSQCLADQSAGAFWDFADFIHGNPQAIMGSGAQKRPVEQQMSELDKVTEDMGKKHSVDVPKLEACIKQQPRQKLDESVHEADELGVSATPAIFINGMKLEGAVPEEQFRAALDQALEDAGVGGNASASGTATR